MRRDWRHLTKVDPDKTLTAEQVGSIVSSGTDAVVLGGTQGITGPKVAACLGQIRGRGFPVWIEVSDFEALVPGADGYFIPVVLNSPEAKYLAGAHWAALTRLLRSGWSIPWERISTLGYIVMNPGSAVGTLTRAVSPADQDEAAALALFGCRVLGIKTLYIEYSGVYGDPDLLRSVRRAVPEAHLLYGGGIDRAARAAEMGGAADTIVVGNLVHSSRHGCLSETVRAVRAVRAVRPGCGKTFGI